MKNRNREDIGRKEVKEEEEEIENGKGVYNGRRRTKRR